MTDPLPLTPGQVQDFYRNLPTLRTKRLLLRKVTLADAPAIHAYASDSEVTRYLHWYPNPTLVYTEQRVATLVSQYESGDQPLWGIERIRDQQLIGAVDLRLRDASHGRGVIGYILKRKAWGHGYVTEAVNAVIDRGFQLGLNRIQATCDTRNLASARVLEKVGMRLEGIMRQEAFEKGAYRDTKLYAILRSDWLANHARKRDMRNIAIRPYRPSDHPAVAAMSERFADYLVQVDNLHRVRHKPGHGEFYAKKIEQEVMPRGSIYLAAESERKLVGFVAGVLCDQSKYPADILDTPPTKDARITQLFVDEPYRGQGIARALMARVERHFKKLGCDVMRVEVFAPNSAARGLYYQLGYQDRDIDLVKVI